MKINISRQNIYLLTLSVFLFVFVLVFAFALLIPEGKDYRNKKAELKKENVELRKFTDFRDEVLDRLTELKKDNRNIIKAFKKEFDADRFEKQYKSYFKSLTLSKKMKIKDEEDFSIYEVKTSSQINSPKSFYEFLDAINKSDWIISINFPIHFQRESEMIRSSFTMKVYEVREDSNTSKLTISE